MERLTPEALADYCNKVAVLSFKKRNLIISTSPEGGKTFDEAVRLQTKKPRKRNGKKS